LKVQDKNALFEHFYLVKYLRQGVNYYEKDYSVIGAAACVRDAFRILRSRGYNRYNGARWYNVRHNSRYNSRHDGRHHEPYRSPYPDENNKNPFHRQ
jgi:hypothetical protein